MTCTSPWSTGTNYKAKCSFPKDLCKGCCTRGNTVAEGVCGEDAVHIGGMVSSFILGYNVTPCHSSS